MDELISKQAPKEVVQCKNCGWHDEYGEDFCWNFNICVKDNDYCSLWEKKRRKRDGSN